MSGTVWSKFFWSDWRNDAGLRLCSFAARGLWMDMLSIAAEAEPVGYVVVAGKPLRPADLARLLGGTVDEIETLLAELESNGVFSRDRRGAIYSRRLVRDAKKAAKSRENGKKGGNPTLGKKKDNPAWDNPPDNPASGISHMPYARSHKVVPTAATAAHVSPTDASGKQAAAVAHDSPTDASRQRPPAESLWASVVHEAGIDRMPRMPTHWMPPAAELHVERWRTDLGLSETEVISVVRSCRARFPEPPSGPKAFDRHMQVLAAQKAAPPLNPINGAANGHAYPPTAADRRADARRAERDRIARLTGADHGGDPPG